MIEQVSIFVYLRTHSPLYNLKRMWGKFCKLYQGKQNYKMQFWKLMGRSKIGNQNYCFANDIFVLTGRTLRDWTSSEDLRNQWKVEMLPKFRNTNCRER